MKNYNYNDLKIGDIIFHGAIEKPNYYYIILEVFYDKNDINIQNDQKIKLYSIRENLIFDDNSWSYMKNYKKLI